MTQVRQRRASTPAGAIRSAARQFVPTELFNLCITTIDGTVDFCSASRLRQGLPVVAMKDPIVSVTDDLYAY